MRRNVTLNLFRFRDRTIECQGAADPMSPLTPVLTRPNSALSSVLPFLVPDFPCDRENFAPVFSGGNGIRVEVYVAQQRESADLQGAGRFGKAG